MRHLLARARKHLLAHELGEHRRLGLVRALVARVVERSLGQQLDQLLGTIQSKPIYQAAVTSQENFDKIMARVNNWILDGIKRGAASPIITLG